MKTARTARSVGRPLSPRARFSAAIDCPAPLDESAVTEMATTSSAYSLSALPVRPIEQGLRRGDVVLSGEFDLALNRPLRRTLHQAIVAADDRIRIDLTAVTFIDATTITVLIEAHRKAAAAGRHLHVHGANGFVLHILTICDVLYLFANGDAPPRGQSA